MTLAASPPPPRAPVSSRNLVIVAFFAVSLIWGSTYLGIRVALEGFPPFVIGAIRFVVAGAALFAFLRLRGAPSPRPIEWVSATLTGSLFFVVGNGLVNVAEQRLSSGLASVLVATMPLWATLFERFAGSRIHGREWAGIGLGFAGVVLLNLGGELRASGVGAMCGLIAPMGWALGSIVSKRLPLPGGPMRTAIQMLCGGAVMALVSAALGERFPSAPSGRAVGALVYLVLFGSLAGMSAYNYLLHHTRTTVATSYAYVNPVIAVALGVTLAGERLDVASGAGAIVILAAVLLITRGKSEPREQPAAAPLVGAQSAP